VKAITPPQAQLSLQLLSSAGKFVISTVGAPGTHGAGKTGTQGIGVSTPSAAAVAAATVGLLGELHTPKGGTFSMGTWSMIVPATILLVMTGRGVALKVDGAAPKVQVIIAVVQTCIGMMFP
jgi:hypothetical protein